MMINYKGPLNYEDFKAQFLDNSDYDAENIGWNGISVTVLNVLLQTAIHSIEFISDNKIRCKYLEDDSKPKENIIDLKDKVFLYSKENNKFNNEINTIAHINIKKLYFIFYAYNEYVDCISLAIKNDEENYYLLESNTIIYKDKIFRAIPASESIQIFR